MPTPPTDAAAPLPPLRRWVLSPGRFLPLDRPRLMAVLNLTPDSFSDGGRLPTPDHAADAAERFLAAGADVLDLGGESTRPGAAPVEASEQIRRVVPAISAIRGRVGAGPLITIDTTRADVAAAALDAGADAINDVSGGLDDPAMLGLAAARGAGLILMHRLRPPSADAYSDRYATPPRYPAGVVAEVRAFLASRAEAALAAGVQAECLVLDPGLGFGKTVRQNLELIARTPDLASLGYPILSALSLKSFSARAAGMGGATTPDQRQAATLGLVVAHRAAGASIFRVHDVASARWALLAAEAARQPDDAPWVDGPSEGP